MRRVSDHGGRADAAGPATLAGPGVFTETGIPAGPSLLTGPGALAGLGVLAQIACPLLSGAALRGATIASVLLLAVAALTHLRGLAGPRAAALLLVVAAGIGFGAEAVGVHTGVPFGHYAYSGALGPRLGGVPLLVPLAWTMLAYPALLLGRRMSGRAGGVSKEPGHQRQPGDPAARLRARGRAALLGGVALASWDLFLDPQMVSAGYWRWAHPNPGLPGVPGVPLTNYAGWLLVSVLMVAALDAVLSLETAAPQGDPASIGRELVPAAVLAWTWLGSTLGNLAFFDRPWVAVWGGVLMGAAVLPYLRRVVRVLLRDVPRHRGSAPSRIEVAS